MRKPLYLVLSAIAALDAGCVTVPNTEACSAAGSLLRGAVCAESLTGKTRNMTWAEFQDMLEPTAERAGAICRTVEDDAKIKTALEQACRMLGRRCSYEALRAIQGMRP